MTSTGIAQKFTAGEYVGTSNWVLIDQTRINAFADVTIDQDPMHVDPAWVKANGPYEHTISFGFLTMSLLTYFSHQVLKWEETGPALNYGFNRLRFVEPVPVNSRVRGVFHFGSAETRPDGRTVLTFNVVIEIEGKERPAVVAEWLSMPLEEM